MLHAEKGYLNWFHLKKEEQKPKHIEVKLNNFFSKKLHLSSLNFKTFIKNKKVVYYEQTTLEKEKGIKEVLLALYHYLQM